MEAGEKIYVGTSGWSYPDWVGIVYPRKKPPGFDQLSYLSEYFDAVEVNTTFYRPPNPDYCRKWLRNVSGNPRFRFTMKLWQRFTHEREEKWSQRDVDVFKEGIDPIVSAGKLGALLVQFPWSFRDSEPSREWVASIADTFKEYPLVIEVRHISWMDRECLDFFRERKLNFCNIDQPHTRNSIGPTSIATGDIAYYRLHGRNYKTWFSKDAGRDARYDYLYQEKELDPWISDMAEMEKRIEQIYIMANNHYRGQAPVNALQIKARLTGQKVKVPVTLIEYYPVLKKIAGEGGTDARRRSGELF